MIYQTNRKSVSRKNQKGAVTMFSAILILILLTEMIIYAVQVGVFEQRKSGNELRQKIAFHTADSAIQHAKEFLLANSIFVASGETELVPIVDGKGDIVGYKPGWLSAGTDRWTLCAGAYETDTTHSHPCWAESVPDLRDNSYFYNFNDSDILVANPVVGTGPNETVTLHALLCMLDIDRDADPVVQGCTTNPGLHDSRYFLVTLLARGQADCNNNVDCTAEALISEKIGSFGPGGGDGGPGAPLTTKSTLPESGDTDIVTNPNGGGVGVPVSVWIDAAADIEGFGGSWTTCEAHEWYETDILPEDYKCPAGSGNCTCDGKKQLSHAEPGAGEQFLNMDMVPDPMFPPDLFFYLFRQEGNEAGVDYVKGIADDVIDDCSGLGQDSYGLIVVEGSCDLNGNVTIGSPKAPVFLVMTGASNSLGGTVDFFGTLFITDAVNPAASVSGQGTITMYGALIADGDISKFGGNLKLVYVKDIIDRSFETGSFGTVAGGWSDFHADWR
jgi:hypothetical protein